MTGGLVGMAMSGNPKYRSHVALVDAKTGDVLFLGDYFSSGLPNDKLLDKSFRSISTGVSAPVTFARQEEPDTATVIVKASVEGADISLDGNYKGSTPSTLRVKPGRYALSIEKPGYKVWQRNLDVASGDAITIDASMEKNP